MARFNIAHVEIARLVDASDGAAMAPFMAQLAAINAIADAVPGFFWRMQDDTGTQVAMWAVTPGHIPSIDEALARLWHLDRFGPTRHAFGFP